MSSAQWASLALAAVVVFWMVGAYNRLVALRTTIGQATQQVLELVQRRVAAAEPVAAAARGPMASEQGALDAWLAAHGQVRKAAEALRVHPVAGALAAEMVAAEAALAAAGSRVLALLEQHPDVSAAPEVAAQLAQWREADARLVFARQLFNEAAAAYNEAARQFPTRLLTRLFGFGTAGKL